MRHRVSGTKFSVSKDHRKMLLRNLVTSLVLEGRLVTTSAKAKALKGAFDKFVTRVKDGSITSRRFAKGYLTTQHAVDTFFNTRLSQLQDRSSGYVKSKRLVALRSGDAADQVEVTIL